MIRNFSLIVFLLASIVVGAQTFTDPVSYMNYIGVEHELISKDLWDYTSAAAHSKRARKIENRRIELLKTIQTAMNKIKRMAAYQGDLSYRDSVISYLNMNKIMLNEDYAKLVDMEDIAEQSYDAMEAYLLAKEIANQKMDASAKMLVASQKSFAQKNNVTLTENEKDKISKNLSIAGEVIEYYNVVYLIFFKSYKQDIYLTEAITKGDMNGIEQNRTSLIQTTEEGLKKLAEIKSFKSDLTLVTDCIEILKYYNSQAIKTIPEFQNFYMQKEKYEKTRAAFEAKKQNERTQSDIDIINKETDSFNKSVAYFNKLSQTENDKKNQYIEKWNTSANSFMDKHVPK